MKQYSAIVFAAGLLLTTSALAEQHHDHGQNGAGNGSSQQSHGGNGSQNPGGGHGGQNWQGSRQWQGAGGGGSGSGNPNVQSWHGTWHQNGNWTRQSQSSGNGSGNPNVESWHGSWQQNQQSQSGNPNASRWNGNGNWQDRRNDGRGNWNGGGRNWGEGRNFRSAHQFHHGSYRRPYGWYYRRWSYGEYLPAAFWSEDYWLNDWWQFDLSQPPYGCEWVRYGNDALLINIYSGQILEVEYNVFY